MIGVVGVALIVVTGSPGCGKSTWVRGTAKPGDIRFDNDDLTNLLTGKTEGVHHHEKVHKKISDAAREAGIREAVRHAADLDVYILQSNLSVADAARWRNRGAKIVIVDPGEAVAMQRCQASRPGYKRRLVTAWYDRREQWPSDAVIVREAAALPAGEGVEDPEVPPAGRRRRPARDDGMGWQHQKNRERLKRKLVDGTECWWCGRPMHRDQVLHADHSVSRSKAGMDTLADRLLHGACNEQRQDGRYDDRRPALHKPDSLGLLPIRMGSGGVDARYPVGSAGPGTDRKAKPINSAWFSWS